jgi:ABC-2 type transport system ATP-binding protein
VDDLSLRRPSLDEVFLALTGHLAEAEEDLLPESTDPDHRDDDVSGRRSR